MRATAFVFASFALASVACLGTATPTAAADDAALTTTLRGNLTDYLKDRGKIEHISALSLTFSARGAMPVNVATGTTTFDGATPVTPDSLFQTGSNTKAFTAAIMLRLEADGALSLDDTLGKWLPQYPAWSGITLRRLLNMTSGLPTYDNTPAQIADYSADPNERSTLARLVAYVYPTAKPPGTAFEYSNTGYILSQMIIDKASPSHDYETELSKLIASLGLKNTYYEPYFYSASITQRMVSGYYVNPDPPALTKLLGTETTAYSLGWAQAAGGMVSTPEDLTTWVRDLFEGNVLPKKQLDELESIVAIPSGKPLTQTSSSQSEGFGLGVFQITAPKLGLFWAYQGSTIGYRASYAYFPNSGAIICIFTNSQTAAKLNTINTTLVTNVYDTLKAAGRI